MLLLYFARVFDISISFQCDICVIFSCVYETRKYYLKQHAKIYFWTGTFQPVSDDKLTLTELKHGTESSVSLNLY